MESHMKPGLFKSWKSANDRVEWLFVRVLLEHEGQELLPARFLLSGF